jgi:hypothetical protein
MSALIGLLLAMLGQLLVLPTAFQQQQQAAMMTTIITTAQQQQALLSAAQAYISQNLVSIEASATASTPAVISVATLAAANVGLPASFSTLNPFGQTWSVQVLQPTAGTLQILVMATGGTALSDLQAAAVAQNVGQPGGFIPQNDSGVYPLGAARVYGNQANFNIATTGYSGVTGGHPAALLVMTNGQVQSDALYRVAVPGQSQLNTMSTGLNMGGNAITNANGIATSGGSNAQSVQVGTAVFYGDSGNAAVRTNGGLYIQNTAGTGTADIASVGNVNSAGSVSAAGNVVAAGWTQGGFLYSTGNAQVNGSIQVNGNTNTSGNVNVGGYIAVNGPATLNAGCPGPQYIGQGPSGPLLCYNGKWTQPGGGNNNYVSYDLGSGAAFSVPTGTSRVDGWIHYGWGGNTSAVSTISVFDTSGNLQNSFVVGTNSANDGGAGSDWYMPISIPCLANTGWITVTKTSGSTSLYTWHVASYTQ